jgi:hypothetical protein
MKKNIKKSAKVKKGVWFVKVRGSYLACSPIGVLLQAILLLAGMLVIAMTLDDARSALAAGVSMTLQLIGLGAIFTWIASIKS